MQFPHNKYLSLLLTLLWCLLILTGCQCAHEWTEADCLTAKTCAKCGEAEGEPLGHDYTPATCTAPETCSRCALTRGEPLGHTYGRWELAEKGKSAPVRSAVIRNWKKSPSPIPPGTLWETGIP